MFLEFPLPFSADGDKIPQEEHSRRSSGGCIGGLVAALVNAAKAERVRNPCESERPEEDEGWQGANGE
jgi:hypothetical protein